jgi:hypothetical protein
MQAPRFSILFALTLAACFGSDHPTLGDSGGGSGGDACPAFAGSCRASDGSYCIDIASPLGHPALEQACEANSAGTWSTSRCDTTGTVGGCRIECAATTWWFSPVTSDQAMQICVSTEAYVPPP